MSRELFEDMDRRVVDDGVNRVQPQPVDVVVANPHGGVVDHEPAYLVAAGSVEVDAPSPKRPVAPAEVRAELGKKVAGRAEMVVDHVEDHRETGTMAPVDQALQA